MPRHGCRELRRFRGWDRRRIEAFARQLPRWQCTAHVGAAPATCTPDELLTDQCPAAGRVSASLGLAPHRGTLAELMAKVWTAPAAPTVEIAVDQELARGTFAATYAGTYHNRSVAVKAHVGPERLDFMQECIIHNELYCADTGKRGARIPKLLAICHNVTGCHAQFLIMERLEKTLDKVTFTKRQFRGMVVSVAKLLQDLQARCQFLHGDMHDSNLMQKNAAWYLIDFGFSALQKGSTHLVGDMLLDSATSVGTLAAHARRDRGLPPAQHDPMLRAIATNSVKYQFNPSHDLRMLFFSFCRGLRDLDYRSKRRLPRPRAGFRAPHTFPSPAAYAQHVQRHVAVGMCVVALADQRTDTMVTRRRGEVGRVVHLKDLRVAWHEDPGAVPTVADPGSLLVVDDLVAPFPLQVSAAVPRAYHARILALVQRYTDGTAGGSLAWYEPSARGCHFPLYAGLYHSDPLFTPAAILQRFAD